MGSGDTYGDWGQTRKVETYTGSRDKHWGMGIHMESRDIHEGWGHTWGIKTHTGSKDIHGGWGHKRSGDTHKKKI